MNGQANHQCKICGVGYYACNDCDKTQNWRAYACSVEHYQLYNILAFYNKGLASKEETIAHLKAMNIAKKDAEKFIEGVREKVIDLLTEPKVEPMKVEDPVVATKPEVVAPVVAMDKGVKKKSVKEKDEE